MKLENGFYKGTIVDIIKIEYIFVISFCISNHGKNYYPVLILDSDIHSKKTTLQLNIILGHKNNKTYDFSDYLGKQVTVFVEQFSHLRVTKIFPIDMFNICREFEKSFLQYQTMKREKLVEDVYRANTKATTHGNSESSAYSSYWNEYLGNELEKVMKMKISCPLMWYYLYLIYKR